MWFSQMHPEWQDALRHLKPNIDDLELKLATQPNLAPPTELVMASFALPPSRVRVIVVGQDPYPGVGVAVGRAFAVASQAKIPASLRNIFQELEKDLGTPNRPDPSLIEWQAQGVWLINRHLTTLAGESGAHFSSGWEVITQAAIRQVITNGVGPLVILLWGAQAQQILADSALSDPAGPMGSRAVLVLKSAHPSPLSARRGFFGSKPFSAINGWFLSMGHEPIDWTR